MSFTKPRELPVAVDVMGGDHAPEAIVAGALIAAEQGIPLVLVGDEAVARPLLGKRRDIPLVHASEQVEMGDKPTETLRRKPSSSMRKTIGLVKDEKACAAVSCGNSGALVVTAHMDLKTLTGLERPAIATVLPRADGGQLVLLDAGANVDCRPEMLATFATLGSALAEALGVKTPKVGLLSIGAEDGKGNAQVRAALPLVRALPLNVVGNVEPSAALAGECDVLVCDGFMGNVLIKSAEGAVETVMQLMRQEIRRNPSARFGAFLLSGALRRFRKRVAWDAHGGGMLLGVNGVVVVGHGRANPVAVAAAIRLAWVAHDEALIGRVVRAL